jgi:hypothetical protein
MGWRSRVSQGLSFPADTGDNLRLCRDDAQSPRLGVDNYSIRFYRRLGGPTEGSNPRRRGVFS